MNKINVDIKVFLNKSQKKSKNISKKLLTFFDLNDIILNVISSRSIRVLNHKLKNR